MPNLAGVNITAPTTGESFVDQPGEHNAYFKAFAGDDTPITEFTSADAYGDKIIGDLPFASSTEAAELVTLTGKRIRGQRVTTADTSSFDMQYYLGQAKHARLYDRAISRTNAPLRGQALGFLRTFPDDTGLQARVTIDAMVPGSDPSADDFLWNVTVSFEDFEFVDLRVIPTYTSKTPETGAVGTDVTITGTNLTSVSSVQFRSAGGAVAATVTTFATQTATSLVFDVPAGLAAATYDVFLMYGANEIAAGEFAVTA